MIKEIKRILAATVDNGKPNYANCLRSSYKTIMKIESTESTRKSVSSFLEKMFRYFGMLSQREGS